MTIIRYALTIILASAVSNAAETAVWDTANNRVTYQNSVANVSGSSTLDFSKFSTADAAAAEGQAGAYTLTRVVLSIDGSVSATFSFFNASSTTKSVTSASLWNNPGFSFTMDGRTASETYTYSDPATPFSVAAYDTVTHDFQSGGNGLAQTSFDNALSAFIGNSGDKISSTVSLGLGINASTGSSVFSALENTLGAANLSVTYYYAPVPEPTALALLGFGCAALVIRRRKTV